MEGSNTEGTEGQQSPAQGEGGTEGQPKDYKALYEDSVKESRKWEKRAKDNKAALDSLKQSNQKADPSIEERNRRNRKAGKVLE